MGSDHSILIINADDFGLNEAVNRAILESFKLGLCSSATLMANMPGFEEACNLVREHKLMNHVGIHLVLNEGYPLTEGVKKHPRFCNREGRLALESMARPVFFLGSSEKYALAEEIRAQIKRCRAFGVPLTHLDSHKNLHNHWAVLQVLIPILREDSIGYVRIARNCGANIGFLKSCYKRRVNRKLRRAGLSRTRYFGSLDDYWLLRSARAAALLGSFELGVHPALDDAGALIDALKRQALEPLIKAIDSYQEAVSFAGRQYV
jgi:predicted glycoside hydrolase/deacetylase ChbG (UPF0249 family)